MIFGAALAAPVAAQQQSPKQETVPARKEAVQAKGCCQKPAAQGAVLKGRQEKLSCKLGTEDRHARIAVELIGGRTKSVAYYSKWKPRTCSVHIMRNDAFSKWEDTGHVTIVTLIEEKGSFLIDHEKQFVKFMFREIDRERFCGMPGKITGSLTVTRGKAQCELEGVMDDGDDLRAEAPAAPAVPVAR